VSQASIDTKMEWSKGFTAQVENGRLRPPDKANCDQLDTLLGLSRGTIWNAAKVERLERFDADLATEWRQRDEQRVASVHDDEATAPGTGQQTSPDEQRVLVALRKLDRVIPSGDPAGGLLAPDLARALEDVVELWRSEVARAQVISACRTLRDFGDMLPGAQLALLQSASWTAHIALKGGELATIESTPLHQAPPPADDVAAFVAERCVVDASAKSKATDLYLAYCGWREQAGRMPYPSARALAFALRDEGFTPRKSARGVRVWLGLRLS
jgi:hypothetical protein